MISRISFFFVLVACSSPPINGDGGPTVDGGGTCSVATETRPCGKCGVQSRTCTNGTFGSFGACTMEGVCAATAMESEMCAWGSPRTHTCSAACDWGAWN